MRARGSERAARQVGRGALIVLLLGLLAIPLRSRSSGEHLRVIGAPAPPAPATTTLPPVPRLAAPSSDIDIPPPPIVGQPPAELAEWQDPASPPIDPGGIDLSSARGAHVWALVIGINDYSGSTSDLRAAVADADDMVAALNRFGVPASNILELTDANADGAGILSGIRWLESVAAPDDTAVVFYAGHTRKLGPSTEAAIAADGAPLPDWYLADKLKALQSRDAWIVMASCYGGGFDELLAPGRILTAAAGANELAYESSALGRSYLGEYLVRRALLNGEARSATVQDAVSWAQAALAQEAPARMLTEVDDSLAPVSLDGVPRTTLNGPPAAPPAPPPAAPVPAPAPAPSPPPAPPASPPPPSSPAPRPCRNLLGLLCPSGTG